MSLYNIVNRELLSFLIYSFSLINSLISCFFFVKNLCLFLNKIIKNDLKHSHNKTREIAKKKNKKQTKIVNSYISTILFFITFVVVIYLFI